MNSKASSVLDDDRVIDPRQFRDILGHFPTGVVAVTAADIEGRPVGMAVGSFTSVSLDPPLVGFLPGKSSSTFPKIRAAKRFCANVLRADQQHVCRNLSRKSDDKFTDVDWTPTPSGMPRILGSLAWIDCEITDVHDAGDHHIVVGRVHHLELDTPESPLIFFQGRYGGFATAEPHD
ncbi:flavin reductase family protein [Rhodococcus pseudokoreensis]|uniref:Flavin reductase family protein n=1 Tax=Rhodococcus pseudokoreensis TaxID=2811421 RepID=A0A974W191_9NOCA|nr:flavin reductase family protein [Rhodococcus pseudokoreensis]QSE89348.1 flavin reductase family protein [Rhodococcus pseudokoreensis]